MYKLWATLGLAAMASTASAVTITSSFDSDQQLANQLEANLLPGFDANIDPDKLEGLGQIGLFENLVLTDQQGHQLSLDKGIVMSTGYLADLPNHNSNSAYGSVGTGGKNNGSGFINDTFPVQKFRGGGLSDDAAEIRIEFTAPKDATGLIARFIYASDEFPEFTGTQFADGFAFVRLGKDQEVNYAIMPNGQPVSLFEQDSNIFMLPNGDAYVSGVHQFADLEFDGLTKILELRAPVAAGQKEIFKLVIADTGDEVVDSAVFMSAFTFFNDPDFDFSVGTVKVEDNQAAKEFAATPSVPIPASSWLFLTGLMGLLGRRFKVSSTV
jgi:hypothetical protein